MWNDRGFHGSHPTISFIVVLSHTQLAYIAAILTRQPEHSHYAVVFSKNGLIHKFQLSWSFSVPEINVFHILVMILIRQLLSEFCSVNYLIYCQDITVLIKMQTVNLFHLWPEEDLTGSKEHINIHIITYYIFKKCIEASQPGVALYLITISACGQAHSGISIWTTQRLEWSLR